MKNMLRVFKFASKWRVQLVFATISLFVSTGASLAAPALMRMVLKILETDATAEIKTIIYIGVAIVGLYLVRLIFYFFSTYLAHIAAWNTVAETRQALYNHLQKLSLSYYKDKQTGQLMSRVVNDTDSFEVLIAHALPDLITNVLVLIGVFAILFVINPVLAAFAVLPMPFILLFVLLLKKIRKYFEKRQAKTAELNAVLQDNFSGMKEIQAFNKQEHELSIVRVKTKEHVKYTMKGIYYVSWFHPSIAFLSSLGTVLVVCIGAVMIATKSTLFGGVKASDIVGFLLYLNLLYAPISVLSRVLEDLQLAAVCARRVYDILDTEPDVKDKPGAINVGKVSGNIVFDNVSFDYDKDSHVIKDVSFEVSPGQMIALVGPTGSGKSTLVSLIARFYEAEKGRITMDGIDITDMTMQSLRNQLSIVLQDVFLFNGTIMENILYGASAATEAQVIEAARAAQIHDFITGLPGGYETVIGERGVRLSGGQKQRLSIARALIRNSPILILDEATSAIDNETESSIQRAINSIAGTRTMIVIAHRLSTIKKADRIMVLSGGRIVESGSHDELISLGGEYSKLYYSKADLV